EHALARLAADGDCRGKDVVESGLQVFLRRLEDDLVPRNLPAGNIHRLDCGAEALAELGGFGAELVVGKDADLRLQRIDVRHDGQHLLDVALVLRAEDGGQYFIDHDGVLPATNKPAERAGLSGSWRARGGWRRR